VKSQAIREAGLSKTTAARYEDLTGPPRGARAAVGFGGLPLGITLFVEFATRLY